jgi:hypothetical protein
LERAHALPDDERQRYEMLVKCQKAFNEQTTTLQERVWEKTKSGGKVGIGISLFALLLMIQTASGSEQGQH